MLQALSKSAPLALSLTLAGCGSNVLISEAAGGGGHSSAASGGGPSVSASSSSTTSSSSTSSSTSTSTSSGVLLPCSGPDTGMPPGPCVPTDPGCKTQSSVCGATHTYGGASTFAMRIVHFTLAQPFALSQGIGAQGLNSMLGLAAPQCSYPPGADGAGWLMRFDGAAGQLTVGFGVAKGGAAYQLVEGDFPLIEGSVHVAPVTVGAPIDAMCGVATTAAIDVNLPLDPQQASTLYFPFRQLRFHDITLSLDHNCIGRYNADGLNPANGCSSSPTVAAFLDGGALDGFIPLEEADATQVIPLTMSLCVFLSGDPGTYGDGQSPNRCKRDGNGHIVFQGDWCASTNQPATGACADALKLSGTFAAAGVLSP